MEAVKLRAEAHWDRVVTCYPKRAGNLAEQIATIAAERPNVLAVVEGDERLSYAELYAQGGGVAALLAAGGVAAGDRVAVVAIVTTEGGLQPHHVRAWCAERLSDYKVPGDVVIETAALPRNANGKIQKAELRQRAALLCEAAA